MFIVIQGVRPSTKEGLSAIKERKRRHNLHEKGMITKRQPYQLKTGTKMQLSLVDTQTNLRSKQELESLLPPQQGLESSVLRGDHCQCSAIMQMFDEEDTNSDEWIGAAYSATAIGVPLSVQPTRRRRLAYHFLMSV